MNKSLEKRISRENPFKICFVCLGNICRSPTAEGVFQHLAEKQNLNSFFEIDSAGTSAYHTGEKANSKSRTTARKHGVTLHSRARRFEAADLEYFDLILAMDKENLANIKQLDSKGTHAEKIGMLRDFDPLPGDNVPDPYYGGLQGFENVFQIVERCCNALLKELKSQITDIDTNTDTDKN